MTVACDAYGAGGGAGGHHFAGGGGDGGGGGGGCGGRGGQVQHPASTKVVPRLSHCSEAASFRQWEGARTLLTRQTASSTPS